MEISFIRKLSLVIIVSLVFVSLAGGAFSDTVFASCHEGCSCCGDSCGCQPAICSFNLQPMIFAEANDIVPRLTLKVFLHQKLIFTYAYQPSYDIFHPPRYS